MPGTSTEVRERAVDAAEGCFRELGVRATTIDDVVRASGVARATLYRHAGGRDDLLVAVVLREIDALWGALASRLDRASSIETLLVEGVLHVVELVRASPVLSELLADPTLLAAQVSDAALEALVARLTAFVEPLLHHFPGEVRADLDPIVAVECLVRTIHSLATFGLRDEASRAARRRYLRAALVPVFVHD